MSGVKGRCPEDLSDLGILLEEAVDRGEELGVSAAITRRSECLVDLWCGWHDPERTTAWSEHSVTGLWSLTKLATSMAALVLIDAGLLDIDRPVKDYWPQFGVNGKDGVLVRHVLSHSSGVAGWEQPFRTEDLYDEQSATNALARQAPWWAPGRAVGYHVVTYGHLVGALVRRTTGRSLRTFVAQEVCGPVGAEVTIGWEPLEGTRVATLVPPPPTEFDLASLGTSTVAYRALTGPSIDPAVTSTPAWRAADIGASNGFGNARGLATLLSVLANRGEGPHGRLLSSRTTGLAFTEQAVGIDLVLGIPVRYSLGFGLPEPTSFPYLPSGDVCFWGGWGGSLALADAGRQSSAAYVMNAMSPDLLGKASSIRWMQAATSTLSRT